MEQGTGLVAAVRKLDPKSAAERLASSADGTIADLLSKMHIGHAVEMAEVLRELIISRPELSIVNDQNYGPVTLFRAYPAGVDTFRVKQREENDPAYAGELQRHNELNRRVFQRVAAEALAGRGVAIGFTDNYRTSAGGEPICALKSYVLSPFADEQQMHAVVERVLEACRAG